MSPHALRRCALLVAACCALATVATAQTADEFAARTRWWRDAKFGMFIHWGVYAVPARGEWYMYNAKVQVKDYEKFALRFNPVRFDARAWVRCAKQAGMKYLVITSKHHDGFCMFDTKLTDYNIVRATPFHRDPMKELAAECRRLGIKLCFYHSIMDWHQPDYLPRRPWETETRPADGASLDRYIDYMKGELRELLTNYGPLGVLWFDGGWEHNEKELHSAEVNAMIRSLQPQILINDRNRLSEDFATPEQSIPAGAMPNGRLWETCMTVNNNWGFNAEDSNWKSTADLIHKLCDIASKGGNFLLNVGPTAEGVFPQPIVERLQQVGEWMRVNGSAIYGTTMSPLPHLTFDGRCTAKGHRLYLHVFTWPAEGLVLQGLRTPVISARALGIGPLSVKRTSAGAWQVERPRRLNAYATVVELRLTGSPDAGGSNALQSAHALAKVAP